MRLQKYQKMYTKQSLCSIALGWGGGMEPVWVVMLTFLLSSLFRAKAVIGWNGNKYKFMMLLGKRTAISPPLIF
jgi:hypothetical protein